MDIGEQVVHRKKIKMREKRMEKVKSKNQVNNSMLNRIPEKVETNWNSTFSSNEIVAVDVGTLVDKNVKSLLDLMAKLEYEKNIEFILSINWMDEFDRIVRKSDARRAAIADEARKHVSLALQDGVFTVGEADEFTAFMSRDKIQGFRVAMSYSDVKVCILSGNMMLRTYKLVPVC